MSVEHRNGIIVGLYWSDIINSGFDGDVLRDMISDEEVDIGSYEYDSCYSFNVIGFWAISPSDVIELDMDNLNREIERKTKKFREVFSIEPKVYLTPFVF